MADTKRVSKRPPPPYDRGWSWFIVIGSFINCFLMMGTMKSYGILLEQLVEKFNVSVAVAALPVSVCGTLYAVASPFMLMLSEMYGIRPVVILGGVVGFLSLILASVLVSIEYFAIMFGIGTGICYACLYANGLVMISFYFRKRLSLATGLGLAGSSVGQFLMPVVLEFLIEKFALGGCLVVMAGIHLQACVAGMLFRPLTFYAVEEEEEVDVADVERKKMKLEKVEEENELEALVDKGDATDAPTPTLDPTPAADETNHNKPADTPSADDTSPSSGAEVTQRPATEPTPESHETLLKQRREAFKTRSESRDKVTVIASLPQKKSNKRKVCDFSAIRSYITQFYTFTTLFIFIGYFNLTMFLPPILTEKGIKDYDKALLLSFCGLGDLVARVGMGYVADMGWIERYKLQAATSVICGVNIFMVVYADNFAWLAIHFIGYGFFGGGFVAIMSVVLQDFVGREMVSKNLGVLLPTQGISAAVVQIILGYMKDSSGNYDGVITLCATFMVGGALMLLLYPAAKRMEEKRLRKLEAADGVVLNDANC